MSEQDYADYEERPGRDVLEYLEIPLRYPRYMWVPFAIIMGWAVLLALVTPPKYRSGTLILVESKTVPERFVAPVTAEGIAEGLNTIRQLVMSRTRLEQVIQKLDPYPEMAGQPSHVIVDAMRAAIEIRVQGTDSFVIEYVNHDPYKAMMVTNMLASRFTEDASRLRDGLTQKAFDFLETNLTDARKTLEQREQALRLHKQKYWGSLPEQLDSNLRVLLQFQAEQQTLGENLRTLEQRRAVLERGLLEGKRLAAAAGGSAGSVGELLKMRESYATLRSRYTEDHPDMRALRGHIATLEKQVADAQKASPAGTVNDFSDPEAVSLGASLRLVEAEIDSLKARREDLDDKIRLFQARVEQTPKVEAQLAALVRDYQQLQENYNDARKKEMDARMARRLEEYWKDGYFRVLDPAYLPRQSIRPYGTLILMGGFVIALGAGLSFAFVADLLDRSVKSERELEELLPYPVLITIPRASLTGKPTATG